MLNQLMSNMKNKEDEFILKKLRNVECSLIPIKLLLNLKLIFFSSKKIIQISFFRIELILSIQKENL
jgi:hypothetical protein